MERWVDVALEEGIRFFVTSLGNPQWVVERAVATGGVVYHDVTERRWALKALDAEVHGLIAVNQNAGGHAGTRAPSPLLEELADLGRPVVCAGGVGEPGQFVDALGLGYAGVQIGTRLIASAECHASDAYKQAIVDTGSDDIVLTERITGVPLAVIGHPLRAPRRAPRGTARALDAYALRNPLAGSPPAGDARGRGRTGKARAGRRRRLLAGRPLRGGDPHRSSGGRDHAVLRRGRARRFPGVATCRARSPGPPPWRT